MNLLAQVDKSWSLFLDRDGVINEEKEKHYVLNWSQFRFHNQATEAIKMLSATFGTVVIVTNQRGIGKGLMTVDDLGNIHTQMLNEITASAGRIDKIYYCTTLDDDHHDRKPNPGMAYQAKKDFPQIELTKSIMVGNKPSDMRFGRNAGMYTIFIASTNPETPFPHPDIDLRFNSLFELSRAIDAALIKS